MKRTPLKRGTSQLKRSPLKKSGTTKAKKVIRQRAFYSSAAWKKLRGEALERANHRCEFDLRGYFSYGDNHYRRCPETEKLQVHHKTNVRFGGDEWLDDLQVLCKGHHEAIERLFHPHRQRSR